MVAFVYDKTFEGLLTAVFDAYDRKLFPDLLAAEKEPLPLFCDPPLQIYTDSMKAKRVWKGLQKKLSKDALALLTGVWLSELPQSDMLLFRYIRKNIDAPGSVELNFGDPDVLLATQIAKKVSRERHRVVQFLRFQKMKDDLYFARIEPIYNVLPLIVNHFKDRYADQSWVIYDPKRAYGYYYDQHSVTEISFTSETIPFRNGKLTETVLAKDEKLFQQLWKAYFHALTIEERFNPKLHRQNLPARFWKYLPEK